VSERRRHNHFFGTKCSGGKNVVRLPSFFLHATPYNQNKLN
jgi:hypothetical protein